MKKGTIWIIVAVMVLAAWFGAGLILAVYLLERTSQTVADSTVYTIRFGRVSADDDHPKFMEETTVLPLRYKDSGYRHGVEIEQSIEEPYTYYFVFHFSKPPKVISGEGFAGKEPSTTMQTESASCHGGTTVSPFWFDPGDPVGEQSLDVYINDKLVKTISFTVTPDS